MKTLAKTLFVLLTILSCGQTTHRATQQNAHREPTHNFTVQRLIILNDNDEMLMCSQDSVWATPSLVFRERQYLREGLDSLAQAYGVNIEPPRLRGYFSYKYDYHPYATLRSYFVARYISGQIQVPMGMEDAQWMAIPEAIERNSVKSIKEITRQIIEFPGVVWGGSFMVRHVGDAHPTNMVEAFYPLFEVEK